MNIIELNVNDFEKGFDEDTNRIFLFTIGLEESINAAMSWFTASQLLEGYKTVFTGKLEHKVNNGINEHIDTFIASLDKWTIENDRIYFDTFEEV